LHHDNAPTHTASKTILFIGASGINLIEPPPYSPDLAPCDFWLFAKVKEPLRGKVFRTREELIEAVNSQLDLLTKYDFKQCFQDWLWRL
jgi:transposase